MAEKGRHLKISDGHNRCLEKPLLDDPVLDSSLSDEQLARIRLRQRWELASVLNFLRVFRTVIPKDLKVSAEDIETALITSNEDLGRIHIALLKGIPPISKNITDSDAWITSVCKKLATWWPWVAEGEIPLKADHGKEIVSYKQLDPTTRLLILKALCEVRAEQDDILGFIADELKKGGVGSFRKERMGTTINGITYWYEGDPVIGHRLYREMGITDSKQKAKGKGSIVKPSLEFQWETIATNLEEFRDIADSLSSSKVSDEIYLGERIKTEILSVLEDLEKKRERALLRKQRQALQLESFLNYEVGVVRSCRERRPIRYTFDEYDRSIDEAIKITMEPNNLEFRKANGNMESLNENSDCHDDEDGDYDGHDDDDDDDGNDDDDDEAVDADDTDDSKLENNNVDAASKSSRKNKHLNGKLIAGLRRSSRNVDVSSQSNFDDSCHALAKKRLRQRPTRNASFSQSISDSEDEKRVRKFKQKAEDSSSTDEFSAPSSGEESQVESSKDYS